MLGSDGHLFFYKAVRMRIRPEGLCSLVIRHSLAQFMVCGFGTLLSPLPPWPNGSGFNGAKHGGDNLPGFKSAWILWKKGFGDRTRSGGSKNTCQPD